MSGKSSLTRNVTSNWVGMVISIAYVLLITPIVIHALDTRLYGAWSFLNGLIAYSELFYLGLGAALVRYVAQARADNDQARINRLASVVLFIYSILGLVCLLIALGASTRVPDLMKDPLTPDVARAISYTCILIGVRLLLAFVGSTFSGLMCGHDRFDLVNVVGMASAVIRFIAIPLLVHPDRDPLLTLGLVLSAISVFETVALAAIAFWYVPGLAVWPARPRSSELKLLYGFGLQSFFVLVAFKLISYTDTTVILFRIDETAVALYSLPLMLVEYTRMCVGGFSGVLLPRLTLLSTQNDVHKLREAYVHSARIGCFIAGWLGALVISLGPAFLTRWATPEYGAASQMVLVWLTVASFAQALSTQVPFPFYQALRLLAFPAVVLFVEGAFNLALSVWLAPKWGIVGVAFATAVPAVTVSLILLPRYLCRKLDLPVRTLLVKSVLPGVLMLAAALGTERLMVSVIAADSYVTMAIHAIVTVPVALVVFSLVFPRDEREMIWKLLRLPVNGRS